MLHIPVMGIQSDTARGNIYRQLYHTKELCTRQMLAKACGISMPTLYQNLSELMDAGLVADSGEEQSTGGRRAKGLCIVPDARISVGISVNADSLRLIAADLLLQELAYRKIPFQFVRTGFAEAIAEALERFLDDFRIDRSRLLGVGIAAPAIISPEYERIIFAPTLDLRDVSIEEFLNQIPYPLCVFNDANCAGNAEAYVREERGNLCYLSLENGVGGCVLIGGAIYEGSQHRSGEFGHICVQPGGFPCSCGKRGCLEAYCSANRIKKKAGVPLEVFFQGLKNHVPDYETLWFDMLRNLATGINTIRMTLDAPLVLGGQLTEYMQPYLSILKEYILAGNPFEETAEFVQLSKLRRHSVPLGAALYFVREFTDSM